jgi:hypothetical protein
VAQLPSLRSLKSELKKFTQHGKKYDVSYIQSYFNKIEEMKSLVTLQEIKIAKNYTTRLKKLLDCQRYNEDQITAICIYLMDDKNDQMHYLIEVQTVLHQLSAYVASLLIWKRLEKPELVQQDINAQLP